MTVSRAAHFVATTALLFCASASHAQGWTKVALKSSEGTQINIDTQITKPAPSYTRFDNSTAKPLYVNVRHPSLTPNSKVRVLINNHNLGPNAVPMTYTFDLQPQTSDQYGFHFSAEVASAKSAQGQTSYDQVQPFITGTTGSAGTGPYPQDVAVTIDNKWQSDPVNGTHNFNFQLGVAQ